MSKPIRFLMTLAGLLSASEAGAQHIFHGKAAHRGGVTTTVPCGTTGSYPAPGYSTGSGYNGYNDFPFHGGGSYAHPYDRWTWPNMSGAYGQGLARYYDPPVK